MGVNGVSEQLSSMVNNYSLLRTGLVTLIDPETAYVMVGGTLIPAAYVRQSEPELGDMVAVVRQGAGWFVLGTSSVSGGNAVQNPSFEEVDAGSLPTGWTHYDITNVSTGIAVEDPSRAIDGTRVLEVGPTAAVSSASFDYSQPIGVAAGQVWELSALVNARYSPGGVNENTADPGLWALWFDNATDLYPTTSVADTAVETATNIEETPVPRVLRGNVTVPGGPSFMRVGLRSAVAPTTSLYWDKIYARRIS